MNRSFESSHRVKFDLFLRYGEIAAAGDRHLAEFMPPWYLADPQTVRSWGFGLTPVSEREKGYADRVRRQERLLSGEAEPELIPTGEEGHLLMKALLGIGDMVSNVNIPNQGQLPDLPLGVIVETNALFRRDEISPIHAGHMNDQVLALTMRHVVNQRSTLHAALNCDRELAFATFMNDPLIAHISLKDGKALFDEMIEAQLDYLPSQWKQH